VIQGNDDIANRAIDLLKEIYTNLGPRLQVNQVKKKKKQQENSDKIQFGDIFVLESFEKRE